MSRTVVRPLEQMASALSADRLPATIPSAASEDEIGQVARALVASISRAKDAVRLEREAAEARRNRLEPQASFERSHAETQARAAARAQLLTPRLAEAHGRHSWREQTTQVVVLRV